MPDTFPKFTGKRADVGQQAYQNKLVRRSDSYKQHIANGGEKKPPVRNRYSKVEKLYPQFVMDLFDQAIRSFIAQWGKDIVVWTFVVLLFDQILLNERSNVNAVMPPDL